MIGSTQQKSSLGHTEDGFGRGDLGSLAFELGVLNGSAWAIAGIAVCALIGIETTSPMLAAIWLGASFFSTLTMIALFGLSTARDLHRPRINAFRTARTSSRER